MTTIDRARSYLAKMPPAISGQGGHAATFNAACRLVEFGLGFETALPLLAEWNQSHCQPQWTDKELGHKLTDAFKRTKPSTKFASAPEQRLSVAARPAFTRQPASPGIADKVRPLDAATGAPSGNLSSEPINRPAPWKLSLRAGEPEEHAALARLRGLSVEAIALASERGLLRFGSWSRLSAWFIVDKSNRVAQARRLDGLPWQFGGPDTANRFKTFNVPGSQGNWPVGIQEAQACPSIALVEGGPDLLAAFHFLIQQGRVNDCAPVAMLGAYMNIHTMALPLFAGKRVRIFADADESGDRAVKKWSEQLAPVLSGCDAFSLWGLPLPDETKVKDLNDVARMAPEAAAKFPFLASLFR